MPPKGITYALAVFKSGVILTSVTVINSNSTTDADALATALNAMPFEQALDFSNNNNMSVMFIIKTLDASEIVYSDSWYDLIND